MLADEGLHGGVVRLLRGAGYDVSWIKEMAAGSLDAEILAWSDIGEFVLLTNDSDFSDLIFSKRAPQPVAILYSRLEHRLAQETFDRFVTILERRFVPGHMITITKDGERVKPFPIGASNV